MYSIFYNGVIKKVYRTTTTLLYKNVDDSFRQEFIKQKNSQLLKSADIIEYESIDEGFLVTCRVVSYFPSFNFPYTDFANVYPIMNVEIIKVPE